MRPPLVVVGADGDALAGRCSCLLRALCDRFRRDEPPFAARVPFSVAAGVLTLAGLVAESTARNDLAAPAPSRLTARRNQAADTLRSAHAVLLSSTETVLET